MPPPDAQVDASPQRHRGMGDDAQDSLGRLFTACEVTKDQHNSGLSDSVRLIDLSNPTGQTLIDAVMEIISSVFR